MYHDILSVNDRSFNTDLALSLSDLFKVNTYSDVTLVSDDQIEFKAHKSVLSACSPFMKDLLLDTH